jgi:glycosidase
MVIAPSVQQFYAVPTGEKIQKIAFVFRNEDGSKTGKTTTGGDIFVDIFQSGVVVDITSPEGNPAIFKATEQIPVKIQTNNATTTLLYVDNILIKSFTEKLITHTLNAYPSGTHWIKAIATDGTKSVSDSVSFFVIQNVETADLPSTQLQDGINYIDDKTVTLVLFAPNKKNVFVLSELSKWQVDNQYMMKQTTDGKRYWITLNNLTPQKEYIFQYLVDGQIRTADPYTDKISDPWNDKYIISTIYPGLIAYPDGKTTEIASIFQTGQKAYSWLTTNFVAPNTTDLVIYELHIRDFISTRQIKTVMDSLNYLQKLGINAIELMPINEFEGNDSWGYNPAFYFAPDKAYGTKDDYKKFIDECHKRGIAVIIDMVLNHSYDQSPFVRLYASGNYGPPTAENPWYNVSCPHDPYCWGSDFNHESTETQTLVDRINKYWLTEYKVDGYRFDFTKGFTNKKSDGWAYDAARIKILKRMATEIWKTNSKAYVIFEHLSDNVEEKELSDFGIMLWGNMNGKYNEATMGWNETDKSDMSYASYSTRGWTKPTLISYMESHDEERLVFKNLKYGNIAADYNIKSLPVAVERIELAANFFFTIPGPKMVWQFGELGYDISIDSNGRVGAKPVKWDYVKDATRYNLYQVFSALINLKKSTPIFRTSDITLNTKGIYKTMLLRSVDVDLIAIGNFDIKKGDIPVEFSKTGDWFEYYTGEKLTLSVKTSTLTLLPGEYRIYTTKQFAAPAITPMVKDVKIEGQVAVGQPIKGVYTYRDANKDTEGTSIYKWYRTKNANGSNRTLIPATTNSYTITDADKGYFIVFEVTPVSKTGSATTGYPGFAVTSVATGIAKDVIGKDLVIMYPNPVSSVLYVNNLSNVNQVRITDILGKQISELKTSNQTNLEIDLSKFPNGIYLMNCYKENNQLMKVYKIIKK